MKILQMAEEFQLKLQTELCKAEHDVVKKVTAHLAIDKLGIEGRGKVIIVNKIGNVIEEKLTKLRDEEKLSFLQEIMEMVSDIPPPLEEFGEEKEELLGLKKEIEELKLLYSKGTPEIHGGTDSKMKAEKVISQTMPSPSSITLHTLTESTSILRRQFKMIGQIGDPDQKDKLTFNSLMRQIDTAREQGYKEKEIVDGVIRAITPGLVLRSYLESYKDLSLERLSKILRSHYGEKNPTELYQSLASMCQSSKETPQAFLMRALDLRQKILLAGGDSKGSLKYEADHIQRLFFKTLETGFLDENIRVRLRPYLSDHQIADEDLIYQVNSVVSSEAERDRKLKLQSQGRSPRVFQVDAELEGRTGKRTQPVPGRELHLPTQDQTISAIQGLKAEVEALRAEVQKRAYTNPPSTLSSNHNYQASPRQQVPAHDENWEGRRVERGSQGPRMERSSQGQRQFKCSVCQDKGEEKCIHCFICGGDNHYAVGCRQPRPQSNQSRLPPQDRK